MRLAAPARFCALLSFCILFTLGGITAFGQWTKIQLGGSDFNPGTALFVDGSTIYVGSTGMVFRSTDGGTSFDKLNNGIGDALSGCTDIVKIGNRVYAAFGGNGGRGVYYSEDQGDTWIADTAGWQAIANVPVKPYARRLHAFNDTHLFAILETTRCTRNLKTRSGRRSPFLETIVHHQISFLMATPSSCVRCLQPCPNRLIPLTSV